MAVRPAVPPVAFEHIDKIYPGGSQAISDFTLFIPDGELTVFVGPSGCGKSTLLRLLAGLEEVTHGTLCIGERIVNGLVPQERNVAMVFQDYALYPHMTVRQNLAFPLKMRKRPMDEIQQRVRWAAEILGMTNWLDHLPKQISGGQRQRVAMGRALVRDPAVFLLDEPLSNLDAQLRVQVRAEIGELQRRMRTTMIYVTHDQVEAMTLGHRVAVIHQGRLQQVASPKELYERPANTFVAGFIGNPPMNLFPSRLFRDGRGRLTITWGDQTLPFSPRGLVPDRLQDTLDKPLTGGVRPEVLRPASHGPMTDSIRAIVEDVEYLGHETLVHARVGQEPHPFVARLSGMQSLAKGELLSLDVKGSPIYLFGQDGALVTEGVAIST